jgi:glycosyltransferase involved in cell wall biosynthesis
VDPLNVADIRRGIEDALAKPRDDRLRRHVAEQFTWDRTARQIIQAYESVLGSPAEKACCA